MKKKIIGGIALGLLGVFSLASCNLTITDNTKNQDQTDSGSDSDTKTETFTITFNSMGGSSVTSQTVKKGNKATKPADPTRSGYTFAGWYKEEAYTNKFNFETTTITYDRTLYAKWTQNSSGGGESTTQYTVTFDANGHGTAPTAQTISKGGTVTKPANPTATGYTFGGWYKESGCINAWNFTSDTVNSATTLYAKWTTNTPATTQYTVTLNPNGGSVSPTSIQVTSGQAANVSSIIPTKTNYSFAGWYKEQSCTTPYNGEAINNTTTLYAKWSSQSEFNILQTVGYNEAIYFTFNPAPGHTNSNEYTVSYKKHSETDYKTIDNELVRINNNVGRADILGLEPGNYDIKIFGTGLGTNTKENIEVVKQDRSGYGNFDNSTSDKLYSNGVGAYNNNGTLKSNTDVIYVSDATKNTVEYNGQTGIVNILANLGGVNNPVCIRFLDMVKTCQWNPKSYSGYSTKNELKELVKADYGDAENTGGKYFINALEGVANSYSIDLANGITKLNGLEKFSWGTTTDSYWNMCDIKGTDEKPVSNVTIEGVGTNAGLFQWGLTWKNCKNIEVKNLTFDSYTEDACSFEGSTDSASLSDYANVGRYWIHNNTFNQGKNNWDVSDDQDKHEGDGATDFKRTGNITVSYNHYYNNHKTGLVGSDDNIYTANVTFHHNFYESCASRLPLGRNANMHMYNNYYYGTTGTNMSIRARGYVFIENCVLNNCKNPFECKAGVKKTKDGVVVYDMTSYTGAIKSYNNELISCSGTNNATEVSSRTTPVTNSNSYGQTFDTNSSIFYYDSTNQKSKVSIMNNTSDLPTLIPTVAGAGIFTKLNYSI